MTRIRNSETKLQCQSDNVTLFVKHRTVIRDHLNRRKSNLSDHHCTTPRMEDQNLSEIYVEAVRVCSLICHLICVPTNSTRARAPISKQSNIVRLPSDLLVVHVALNYFEPSYPRD